ncbi:MAG TPA: tetratricopeptide repeat protein [Geminicoccaceae bacterium]|nr:tetratricopeptide repeat protein [Geminicoccaceae bacterium]
MTSSRAGRILHPGKPRWAAALLGLGLLAGCAGWGTPPGTVALPQPAPSLFRDRGEAALAAEDHAAAAREFAEALRGDPDDTEARLGLADARLGLGDAARAATEFEALAELARAEPAQRARALQGRAIALLHQGRGTEAQPLLLEATRLKPLLWRAWNALGQTYDSARAPSEARAAYARALELRPLEPAIHNNLGMSWLHAGDPVTAERHFARAVELAPRLAVAAANLRLALALQGHYDEALAGAGAGQRPDALNNVGYVALLRGDHARAEGLFLAAMEASPSFYQPAWLNLQFLGTMSGGGARPRELAP